MILDTILLVAILLALHYYKSTHPDFLFFCKGAILFLPPNQPTSEKSKKKKSSQQHQIEIIKIKYDDVKQFPFSSEFYRILMTTLGVSIYAIIRVFLSLFVDESSMLMFYIIILITGYMLKMGVDILSISPYNKKICVMTSLGINILFYLLMITLGHVEGVYDGGLASASQDYSKHLEIVLNKEIGFMNEKVILGLVLMINFFVILLIIPSVIKFGNWYAKTLKEVYYQQDQDNNNSVAIKATQSTQLNSNQDHEPEDDRVKQQKLRQQSKEIIRKLNLYLAIMLILIFLSHKYASNFLSEKVIDVLRSICVGVCCFVICSSVSKAVEFNGAFAYKFVVQYFKEEDAQKRTQLRKRIASYIHHIWYHYFQYMLRIFVMVLLFLLVINWKYFVQGKQIQGSNASLRSFNPNIQCSLQNNPIAILQHLYQCPIHIQSNPNLSTTTFVNGFMTGLRAELEPAEIQARVLNLGLLTKDIMIHFSEALFWYSTISLYSMTVIYILFLRKTVYEI